MSAPVLIINNHDYTVYAEEIKAELNALDAEGSGRDVQTGQMFRTHIADKVKLEVSMLRLPTSVMIALTADLMSNPYYTATFLDPKTGAQATKTFYTSTVPYGVQRYLRSADQTVYDGVSFSMIER